VTVQSIACPEAGRVAISNLFCYGGPTQSNSAHF